MSQEEESSYSRQQTQQAITDMWEDFFPLCKTTACITIKQKYIHKKSTSSILSYYHTSGMLTGIKLTLAFNTALFCDAHFWPV